jgi:hypothetical protein
MIPWGQVSREALASQQRTMKPGHSRKQTKSAGNVGGVPPLPPKSLPIPTVTSACGHEDADSCGVFRQREIVQDGALARLQTGSSTQCRVKETRDFGEKDVNPRIAYSSPLPKVPPLQLAVASKREADMSSKDVVPLAARFSPRLWEVASYYYKFEQQSPRVWGLFQGQAGSPSPHKTTVDENHSLSCTPQTVVSAQERSPDTNFETPLQMKIQELKQQLSSMAEAWSEAEHSKKTPVSRPTLLGVLRATPGKLHNPERFCHRSVCYRKASGNTRPALNSRIFFAARCTLARNLLLCRPAICVDPIHDWFECLLSPSFQMRVPKKSE